MEEQDIEYIMDELDKILYQVQKIRSKMLQLITQKNGNEINQGYTDDEEALPGQNRYEGSDSSETTYNDEIENMENMIQSISDHSYSEESNNENDNQNHDGSAGSEQLDGQSDPDYASYESFSESD